MAVRKVTIPTCDPVEAAIVIQRSMRPTAIDDLVALLLETPHLADRNEES